MLQKLRVLIVDDSVVFRSQLRSALCDLERIEIVGVAANGKIALQKLDEVDVDLVTLDLEMPEMDGLAFLRELSARKRNVKVIVFSAHSARSATITLDALKLGAIDYVLKPNGDTKSLEEALEQIRTEFLPKIAVLLDSLKGGSTSSVDSSFKNQDIITELPSVTKQWRKSDLSFFVPKVIVIASSTGGPPALDKLFHRVKWPARVPVLIAQHMPPVFTTTLAQRLGEIAGMPAAEGKNGQRLEPGTIYIAPGDFHMSLFSNAGGVNIKLSQSEKRNSVRPAADYLFESAAAEFGKNCLGVVLTGMGADGKDGAIAIKNAGGTVLIQNKESSVVWGMPGAVYDAGAYDWMGDLEACGDVLSKMISR